ncbi:MAG: hypothetical protein ACLQSR_03765 [Limisphaerales bacterium]
MKKIMLFITIVAAAGWAADAQTFHPGRLAVLQAGDGGLNLHLKQSPLAIDEFIPGTFNALPSFTVKIPTNGPQTLFINGHAATEGMLSRSDDKQFLTLAGYGGVNLLQLSGTPSLLDIGRGFCTVDANGRVKTTIYEKYTGVEKMNPRGAVTDGANNFWSCGNAQGTVYYNDASTNDPIVFSAIPNSRDIKIVDHVLYATLNGPDGVASDLEAGIFSFADADGNPAPLPQSPKSSLVLAVAAKDPYTKTAGFDMNPGGTIAYTADTAAGIQKYVKTGGAWKFAYNFSIPQNIPAADNHENGCFALAVDFSGAAPIIYATTTEGYNGCSNSNRVVQIVDTNAMAAVTTIAQSPSAEIVYRGIDFTPETPPAAH